MAILFVITSHFFLNTPGLTVPFEGVSLFIQGMIQTLTLMNVPLFLLLTGYLNINKIVNRRYYRGIIAVILSYLFISFVTIIFKEYFLHEHKPIVQWILKITDFSVIAYAWYIEMWIGLFLLTPFLNILWKNIETRRHKHILIVTLYMLCALPDFFNRYGVHLVPGYWELIYPCGFYFIGCYIREYKPKYNSLFLLAFIIGCCLINPVFNSVFVKNHSMIHLIGDGNGIIGMPLAAAVFLLLYSVDIKSRWICAILSGISMLSLDMYLSSYMFDLTFYRWFKERFYITQGQFGIWILVIIPAVFTCSFIFSLCKRELFLLLRLPTK